MIHVAGVKHDNVILPISVTTNADTTGVIDTIGFRSLAIAVVQDTAADATNNPITLNLKESDDLTTYTDVSGAKGDTDWTIPAASTSVANIYVFNMDLRGHKRYIQVLLKSGGAATLSYCHAVLGRAEHMPDTAAEAGAQYVVHC